MMSSSNCILTAEDELRLGGGGERSAVLYFSGGELEICLRRNGEGEDDIDCRGICFDLYPCNDDELSVPSDVGENTFRGDFVECLTSKAGDDELGVLMSDRCSMSRALGASTVDGCSCSFCIPENCFLSSIVGVLGGDDRSVSPSDPSSFLEVAVAAVEMQCFLTSSTAFTSASLSILALSCGFLIFLSKQTLTIFRSSQLASRGLGGRLLGRLSGGMQRK